MDFLKKIFGKEGNAAVTPDEPTEPIVPVPIPPLINLLFDLEKKKGVPLTETEVIEIRDGAVCMTMRISMREQLAAQRGYADIDLENPWPEWQIVRLTMEDRLND
ncbi:MULTISPECIES: hypothetical protein [unclassified Sphingopyxis]|jgi:hypothetical protein|uniref:hypothetical protein n=1 Tax=unclassified Sphingopyxis TaxID=2614943 RepID=UPI0024ADAC52|nr:MULTISPECIES: hypothetical protein [unclassified Sphingopyxis]